MSWARPLSGGEAGADIGGLDLAVGGAARRVRGSDGFVWDRRSSVDISALVAATVEGIADIRASDEGREGVASFLQKRKPAWLTSSNCAASG